jgi:hypothetical protein
MDRRLFTLFLLPCSLLGVNFPAGAQLVRGPELRVNAQTAGPQSAPDAAVAADGHFVVVWVDGEAHSGSVVARVFAADGTPRTGEIRVSRSGPGAQVHPRVAMAANGSFIIVWQARESARRRVYGRRFGADGRPAGRQFPLGIGHGLNQFEPDVACAPDGRFVVAWTEKNGIIGPTAYPLTDVLARRFGADGRPTAAEWIDQASRGNEDIAETWSSPAVAMNGSGAFVIGVEDDYVTSNNGGSQIYAQTYGPDGAFLHSDDLFFVAGDFPWSPSVALADDGTVLVAWTDNLADSLTDDTGDLVGILAERFDAAGVPVGYAIHVNTTKTGRQVEASISMAPNGFLVAWTSDAGQDGDSLGVFAQRFDLNGSPIGPEVGFATRTAGDQSLPAVAVGPEGRGVAVWQGHDRDDFGISARRVYLPPR